MNNNKSSSAKKNSKTSSRKNFRDKYESLFVRKKQPNPEDVEQVVSKKARLSDEATNILKKNIASLNDSSESLKLTEFGKSFLEESKSSPKKSSKVELPKLFSENSAAKVENKRLAMLRNDSPKRAMLTSPSILNSKKSPGSPSIKFLKEAEIKAPFNDSFDRLKETSKHENKAAKHSSTDLSKSSNKCDQSFSKVVEKAQGSKQQNQLHASIITNEVTIPVSIGKELKESTNRLRSMVNKIKGLNEKILAFRQELCNELSKDFPDTQI